MKLLVVDDDRDLVELLDYALRREGYDVVRAYDGETAVDAVGRERPDLVVLDINLPKLTGFVVLERIRHVDEHVSVLLLSARQDESDILRDNCFYWAIGLRKDHAFEVFKPNARNDPRGTCRWPSGVRWD